MTSGLNIFVILAIVILCGIFLSFQQMGDGTEVNIVYDYEDEDEFYEDFMLIDLLDEEEEEYGDEY